MNRRKEVSEELGLGLGLQWRQVREEVQLVSWIAGPMVAVVLSQYLLQVISMMMVGHLGELYLSSSAISISLSGVTGFSVMVPIPFLFLFFVLEIHVAPSNFHGFHDESMTYYLSNCRRLFC